MMTMIRRLMYTAFLLWGGVCDDLLSARDVV